MANRFVKRIRSGDIDSVEELKSEFKELAKLTHPDLREPGSRAGAEEEFAAARTEYEAALRDFEKHRFGAGPDGSRGRDGARGASAGRQAAGAAGDPLPDAAWLCFELLLKRGFPKVARHEKERLRYEYARWRVEQALGGARVAQFGDFESELLDMKARRSGAVAPVLGLLGDFIEYRYARLPAMRTHVVLALGRLGDDPRAGDAVRAFAGLLARDLGIGGELS